MGDLLRLLALDGPVIGVGVLVALTWLIVRLESTRTETAAAHAAITQTMAGMQERLTKDMAGVQERLTKDIEGVQERLTRDIEGGRHDVRELKKDVRMLTAHLLGAQGPIE